MKQLKTWMIAAILICGTAAMLTSCVKEDNHGQPTSEVNDLLKQGIWTEYDEALVASLVYTEEQLDALENPDNYTEEQLEAIYESIEKIEEERAKILDDVPAVCMKIDGDKGYFFTYTAEGTSDLVEGNIRYDKVANKGTITFPDIKDSPVSGQTVDFSMTSDETLQFDFTYEGKKTTGTCAWICENMDNWGEPTTNEEWKELMADYELIGKDWGPDSSIDWGDQDEPLTWDEPVAKQSKRRSAEAILEGISTGIEIFTELFSPDPLEETNAKLDAVTGKLDAVLANQQVINLKLDKIKDRLDSIAKKMEVQENVNIFNDRDKTYYRPLDVQNTYYYDNAFKLYHDNKKDLSKVGATLGEYAKKWVGNNKEYISLTWQYIDYLFSVQHSKYGKGMAKIYDGITYEKYPWEHLGIGDRKNYRAYDLSMIAKCLFMISLYSAYGGVDDIDKGALYNTYKKSKDKLLAFSKFNVADENKFLVCQLPGAHFVMYKELQKYNYKGKNNEAPNLPLDKDVLGENLKPEYHEAGSIKIENLPLEKVMRKNMIATELGRLLEYYGKEVPWEKFLVEGHEKAAGAVFAKKTPGSTPYLFVCGSNSSTSIIRQEFNSQIRVNAWGGTDFCHKRIKIGTVSYQNGIWKWDSYENNEYYAAIVAQRY